MFQEVNKSVSVSFVYDADKRRLGISLVKWNRRLYKINSIDLHHYYRKGQTLLHVFSVSTKTLSLRLLFNTDNMSWILESISDGRME